MATGDFAWLKLQLANLAGRTTVAQLDFDASLAGQCINEAYLDCYTNPDGRRPGWALRSSGLQYTAPATATISVIQGLKTFTGYIPAANKAGSLVLVGSNYYTYAGATVPAAFDGQTASTPLVDGQQSYAIVFPTTFEDLPVFADGIVPLLVGGNGELFSCAIESLTTTGMTVWLSGIPSSASAGQSLTWYASGNVPSSPISVEYEFVEPIQEATGDYSATFYHNSYVLPVADIELQGGPLVINWGLLRPMNDRIEAAKWRQITYGDFWGPMPFGAGLMTSINWPGGVSAPTGTPIWYYIDNSTLNAAGAIACRMVIWPIPLQLTTVQYQGWVMPTELSLDADLPILPANLTTRVLLPLARERWAMTYKKYTGQNQDYLMREADKARATLNLTSQGQRDRPVRVPLRNC